MFAALVVMGELYAHHVQDFLPMIPKLHSMLENTTFSQIYILRMLCSRRGGI